MDCRRCHAKVRLNLRFRRWPPVDLGVVIDEGQVLALFLGGLLIHISLASLCFHTHKASVRKQINKWEHAGGSYEFKLVISHVTHGTVALEPLGQHAHQHGSLPVNVVIHADLVFTSAGAVQPTDVLLKRPAP